MTESLLHYIWKYRLFNTPFLCGTKAEQIELVHVGEHNTDSGPDFFNARLRIDDVLLAGNVEIHLRTSDWLRHRHQYDKAYDNLILHAVFEHDAELPQNIANNVTVLQMSRFIDDHVLKQYGSITHSKGLVACGRGIATVPELVWKSWLSRLAVSRLEDKVKYIDQLFEYTGHHFEDTLYLTLCRNFGFKVNGVAFELLAKQLPYNVIKKHADNPLAVEALLFGTAGFLDEPHEADYARQLQNEFDFLRHKYKLVPLKKELWKFMRLRPVNFPTIRLAQLAAVFCKNRSLFHTIEALPSYREVLSFFDVKPHTFWQSHYRLDLASPPQARPIGESSVASLLINTVVPYLLFLSRRHQSQHFADHALDLLSAMKPENNIKTRPYEALGVKVESALESQAMIHLHDQFCSARRCLDCSVAGFLLKSPR